MTDVCMIVRNSVQNDARVLKEANSLALNNYQVTILGVMDHCSPLEVDQVLPNLIIRRINVRLLVSKFIKLFTLCFIFLSTFIYMLNEAGLFTANNTSFLTTLVLNILLLKIYFKYCRTKNGLNGAIKKTGSHEKVTYSRIMRMLFKFRSGFEYIIFLLTHCLFLVAYGLGVIMFVRKKHVSVLHAHDISTLPVGVIVSKLFKCPLIYDAHELYESTAGISTVTKWIYISIHRISQHYIDGFITINNSLKKIYQSRYPKLPKAVVLMNATSYKENIFYDGRLHDKANLPIHSNIILFQGVFSEHRGISHLISASKYLCDGWAIVFMGWGPMKYLIENESKKSDGRIKIIDQAPQNELVLWSTGAFVGVIPYEDNGENHKYCTPNKIWEFANAGVPMVVTPRIEMAQIVVDNNIGLVLNEPVDAQSLAETIMSIELKQNIYSENCRLFANYNSWSSFEPRLLKLYSDLE